MCRDLSPPTYSKIVVDSLSRPLMLTPPPLCLQYYPLEEILAAEYLLEDFRPDLIQMVLDKLRPENVRWVLNCEPSIL